jgi:hypothetical protein
MEQTMEHEEIQTLMMETLDGDIDEVGRVQMEQHLQNCPTCLQEWHSVEAIHQLFLETPALSPTAEFAERTLSRLPLTPYRIWLVSGVYGLLLISGLVPLIAIIWLSAEFVPAFNQPAFIRTVLQAGGHVAGVFQAILAAAWQGIGTLGQFLGQQPNFIGWLLVMLGIIVIWGSVYNQLTNPRRVAAVSRLTVVNGK